ncbi:MAG: CRTAC1 family protein [Lutibacter sp.]|uniref:CRTAC1 family protein n=1 Tax=Lutibacter sp. TaxID=1925666 RepID=UPI0019E922D2|nr:CRTAC1 family protein [Lutibacter sp.]NOR28886.1 CRTAC1 family protein [Lutibacter sp.]
MKKIKWVLLLIIVLIGTLLTYFWKDTTNPYVAMPLSVKGCDLTVADHLIPKFEEITINFKHQFNDETSLPVLGSCLIDINNDGIDELFIGGGSSQQDGLFQYENDTFKNISKDVKLPSKTGNTLGAVSYDFNQDGFTDILVTRDTGVFVLLNNNGTFSSEEINVQLNEKSTAISLTLGDINQDGFIDMFVAGYIKKELMEGQTIFNDLAYGGSSVLLLNNGDNTFTDITKSAGLEYIHNTFQGIFVDVNKDSKLDLVVAYDTGEPRIYINQDGVSFTLKNNPLTGKYSYPMGIALGDYDNNETVDFFFSNTGTSVPKILAKGDLTEGQELFTDWILFNNDGTGEFKNTAKETNIAEFEFSWGAIFEDFNLDGKQDLVVAENYIAFPPQALFKLPCRFLVQLEDGAFAATEQQANVENKNYAITPLSSDFNNDGYPDLVYANLNGEVKGFMNNGGTANYLKVKMKDAVNLIGAAITINTENSSQTNYNVIGEGLCSDQSNTLIFGLGTLETITSIVIHKTDGTNQTIEKVAINTTITIDE